MDSASHIHNATEPSSSYAFEPLSRTSTSRRPPKEYPSISIPIPPSTDYMGSSSILPLASSTPSISSRFYTPSTRRVLALFLATNLCTLIFTVFPVLVELPGINLPWYTGNDIIRLLEPIVAMPLNFAILLESGIFAGGNGRRAHVVAILFMISAAIYQQGAGFHSASNMFKHPVADFKDQNPDPVAQYPFITELYVWLRDTWEHIISHYMYAAGGILMSMVIAYVYRDLTDVHGMPSIGDRILWVLAALIYGLTIGSVAIEFPKGPIVALVLVLVYGFGTLGFYLYRKEGRSAIKFGRRFVIQYYFASYVVGLLVVIAWIGYAGGLHNREEAGIKF